MADSYIPNQYALSFPQARQVIASVGLAGISLIHLLDLPSKAEETPYQGVLFATLIVVSLFLADRMLHTDSAAIWAMSGFVAAATIVGFVISRTIGLPGAADDVGVWSEPLALASLFVEGVVVWLALGRLGLIRSRLSANPATSELT